MKPSPGIKKLLFALAAVAGLALVFSLLFWSPAKKKAAARQADETAVEGVDLTYLTFNKNNEKKLEVKCGESQKQGDDRLLMKKISATIFKADKLDEDIRIFADSGYAQNDFNDFYLRGHVVISSASFSLSSKSFDLKSLDALSTEDAVAFKLRDLTGEAQDGLIYHMRNKYVKMMRPKGILQRAGRPYRFQARFLRLAEKKKLVLLDQEAQLDGEGSLVRGDRISLQFDPDFANLEWAAAYGKCFFRTAASPDDPRGQSREITARQIKMRNDDQGRLQKIEILGDGEVVLTDSANSGRMRSGNIEILIDPETQAMRSVRSPTPGTLTSKGRDNLSLSGDSLRAVYAEDGRLASIQAQKKCGFQTDDFKGEAEAIHYDAVGAKIDISGKKSTIRSRKNVFTSGHFIILTPTRQLSGKKGVKATLVPGKKGVLLGPQPVFVTAAAMETSKKGNLVRFSGDVNLFQDEIEVHAGELLFDEPGNRISCSGGADLKFSSEGETLALRGNTIAFDPAAAKIVVEGEARLQQAPNTLAARRIELLFGRDDKLENVDAAERVSFSKGEITGRAQLLHWEYARKTVVFRNAAEITRKDAGTTRGQELRFDLESNEIRVSGAGDRSETTIRRERP